MPAQSSAASTVSLEALVAELDGLKAELKSVKAKLEVNPDEQESAPAPATPEAVTTTAPPPEPEPDASAAGASEAEEHQILSVEEIEAMLGVQEPAQAAEEDSVGDDEPPEAIPEAIAPREPEHDSEQAPVVPTPTPEIDLDQIDPAAVAKVPVELLTASLTLPVCELEGKLHCLCAEPFDTRALDAIGTATGLEAVPHAAPVERVLAELRIRFGGADDERARIRPPSVEAQPSLLHRLLRRHG